MRARRAQPSNSQSNTLSKSSTVSNSVTMKQTSSLKKSFKPKSPDKKKKTLVQFQAPDPMDWDDAEPLVAMALSLM